MKKVFCEAFLVIFALIMVLSGITIGVSPSFYCADADEVSNATNVFFVSNQYTQASNTIQFTPLKKVSGEYTGVRMEGTSFKPQKNESDKTMFPQSTKLGSLFSGMNGVSQTEISNYGVKIWMYFDSNINQAGACYELEVGFTDSSDQTKKIVFNLTSQGIRSMVEDYDNSVLAGGIRENNNNFDSSFEYLPYGWVQVSFPLSKATGLASVATNVEDETYNLSTLDSLYISQSVGTYTPSFVYFYSVELLGGYLPTSNIVAVDHQPFAFAIVDTEKVEGMTKESLFIGEYFNLPTIQDVFKCAWLGEKNLLTEDYATSNYFVVKVKHSGEERTYFYGTNSEDLKDDERRSFKMTSGEYILSFCFGKNDGYYPAVASVIRFTPGDYGTGVWFTQNSIELKVGETAELSYKIHEVFDFAGFLPKFKSSNETVVRIKNIDYATQKVTIEAISEGSANIEIIVYDDRINTYTDLEDGIHNSNFSVSVERTKKDVDVVAILLYITAGMFVVYLGFMLYKVIKNRNNYEVR